LGVHRYFDILREELDKKTSLKARRLIQNGQRTPVNNFMTQLAEALKR
jgi:hypothetical protein